LFKPLADGLDEDHTTTAATTEGLRTNVVCSINPFFQNAAFRDVRGWKLIVGRPSDPNLYTEPVEDWLINANKGEAHVLDRATTVDRVMELYMLAAEHVLGLEAGAWWVVALLGLRTMLNDVFAGRIQHIGIPISQPLMDLRKVFVPVIDDLSANYGSDITKNTLYDPDYVFLFHLNSDPSETVNMASQRPDIVRELATELISTFQLDESTPLQQSGMRNHLPKVLDPHRFAQPFITEAQFRDGDYEASVEAPWWIIAASFVAANASLTFAVFCALRAIASLAPAGYGNVLALGALLGISAMVLGQVGVAPW
jgi:hypothetical protein